MNTVNFLSPVRDFRFKAPTSAFSSAAPEAEREAPGDQVLLTWPKSKATGAPVEPARSAPVAPPPIPGVLVDLEGHLGQGLVGTPGLEARPKDTRAPAVLTQFEPQSANQPRIDQTAFQDCLQLDLGGPEVARLQHLDDLSEPNGRLPSLEELSKLSNALYDSSHIPFEYIKDGCYARAHLMCESLRQHGINHSKVFVFGSLGAKNEVQDTRWWYHVAPLVFVQDQQTGAVDARVIDPGLSREPMTVQDWVKACNRGGEVKIDLTSAAQYYPREGKGVETDFAKNLGYAQRTCLNYADELQSLVPDRSGPARGANMALGQSDELKLFPEGLPAAAETAQDPAELMAILKAMTDRMAASAMNGMNFGMGGMYGGMLGMGMGGYGPSMFGMGPPRMNQFVPYGGSQPLVAQGPRELERRWSETKLNGA